MTRSRTDEQALESSIEKVLTGASREELTAGTVEESALEYGNGKFFYRGEPADFNKEYAIDEKRFWHFLETTQGEELEKLERRDPQYKLKILQRLDRMIKKYGVIMVLRKGLKVEDAHFTLMFVPPLPSSSAEVHRRFNSNEFSVMRQVGYSLANPREEIDMVLFINGIPIVTMELKNPWTGQNARFHGQKQYREDRDPKQPLLSFGRCIVHFAVDTDEVYMTTKLAGKQTYFLPFNKGHNNGKGNPPNPHGHKTAYLWEEVLTKQSLANLIQHFVRLDGKESDPLSKRTLFFPRYHQMDVVRKLIDDVTHKGVGKRYLIQHSAGSGKSNSITWLAYQLIEAYPSEAELPGSRGTDRPLYDSVIVVTDRRLLDKQLRDNIREFSEVKNIIAPAYSSADLKKSLESGKKIIITTIQKFPFIIDGITDMSDKRFAVIIDEAHSSQSGTAHDNMNLVMGNDGEETDDPQEAIIRAMQHRKMRSNASYFAFTATPKPITLEKFGVKQEDGSFKPFHLYSMKQAIEEGFILDVLANYTTYKSYYEIQKSIWDNPHFDSTKAQKKLRAFVERNPSTIATKSEIILDHFITKVVNTKKLKGKAKGMVVTQNIESAIRYYKALKAKLEERGKPFEILVAFSGKKMVDGIEYTEENLNGFPGKDIAEKFDEDVYRLLVVANKFTTGFDQPKLCAMYVDKKLQGVQAVQTLSRLNRAADKLGKKSEDLFVLDFFNSVEDIKEAFDPFYTATTLSAPTDVNVLHELKEHLDGVGVYEWHEVEAFNEKYFSGADASELSPIIDVAAERFNASLELDESEKADYKIKAKQFVKIYGQMAAILPYEMVEWEKLFWFLKFLIPKLVVKERDAELLDELLESVDLSTYGLERVKLSASIGLDESESELDPQNPNPRGVHDTGAEKDPLDEIVRAFNERWFQGWDATPEEQRVRFVSLAKKIKEHPDYESKYLHNPDLQNRKLAYEKIFNEVMNQQRRQELDLYRLVSQDEAFKQAMQATVRQILDIAN
jgi:type I restriction enzyme R subunit